MKKFLFSILSLIIINSLSFAFQIEDNQIIDSNGNSVERKKYTKIITTDPAMVEIMYLIDGQDAITAIGRTTQSQIHPVEETEKLPSIGTITRPNLELIISMDPDLVILNGMTTSIVENLKNANIPVLISSASSIDDILKNIEAIGILVGKEENAENLAASSRESMERIKESHKDKATLKGIILLSSSPLMSFSRETLPGEVLELIGVNNFAKDVTGAQPILSTEFIIMEDPDFIAGAMSFRTVDEIKNANPGLAGTKAFRNNNVFIVDSNKILRGSPRIFETIEELSAELSNLKID